MPVRIGTASTSASINSRSAPRSRRFTASLGLVRELHVLLRHRLLPQPHGFEGLAWLGEPLEAHCLAVAEGPDRAVPVLDLNAASAPAPSHCRYDGDAVARVDE